MEFNKVVANPMLAGAIALLKDEDTKEHRNMFVGELQKARLLAPAIIEPEPVENAEGQLSVVPGSKVQFPMLSTPDGKKFLMGFTDIGEYQKWKEKNKELPFFALKLEDYAGMLVSKSPQGVMNPALGFVINPLGENVVVPKEMVTGIIAAKVAYARQQAGKDPRQSLQPSPKPGDGEGRD